MIFPSKQMALFWKPAISSNFMIDCRSLSFFFLLKDNPWEMDNTLIYEEKSCCIENKTVSSTRNALLEDVMKPHILGHIWKENKKWSENATTLSFIDIKIPYNGSWAIWYDFDSIVISVATIASTQFAQCQWEMFEQRTCLTTVFVPTWLRWNMYCQQ